jgi:hypothetical protein
MRNRMPKASKYFSELPTRRRCAVICRVFHAEAIDVGGEEKASRYFLELEASGIRVAVAFGVGMGHDEWAK